MVDIHQVTFKRIVDAAKDMNSVLNLSPPIEHEQKKKEFVVAKIIKASELLAKEDLIKIGDDDLEVLSQKTQCTLFDLGVWLPSPIRWSPYERKRVSCDTLKKLNKSVRRKSQYPRSEALSEALRYGGTKNEIVLRTEAIYVMMSGNLSNMNTANTMFNWVTPVLILLGLITRDPHTGSYSINDNRSIKPLFEVPQDILDMEEKMMQRGGI